jgi:hypothetical protein
MKNPWKYNWVVISFSLIWSPHFEMVIWEVLIFVKILIYHPPCNQRRHIGELWPTCFRWGGNGATHPNTHKSWSRVGNSWKPPHDLYPNTALVKIRNFAYGWKQSQISQNWPNRNFWLFLIVGRSYCLHGNGKIIERLTCQFYYWDPNPTKHFETAL